MTVTVGLVQGFKVGLEYVNWDDDDVEYSGVDASLLVVLDLGFLRVNFFTGEQE